MDLNGLQYNAGAGLINGIAGGMKTALEAYQDARDRKDKRGLLAQQQKRQDDLMKIGLLTKGFVPRGTDYQAAPNENVAEIGGQNYSFDPDKAFNQQKDLLNMKLAAQRQRGGGLLPAESAVDKAYAKTYEDLYANGGAAAAERHLKEAEDALSELEGGQVKTGEFLDKLAQTRIGKSLGGEDVLTPSTSANRRKVENAVVAGLKKAFGGQLSDAEGKKYFNLAYNPSLSPKENIYSIKNLINQTRSQLASSRSAAQYYEQHGTLKGYKGSTKMDPSLLVAAKSEKPGSGLLNEANASSGPKVGQVIDGHRFLGGDPADKNNWAEVR